jgi:RNA polymerase sigma-70 factor (ECF subfamily)
MSEESLEELALAAGWGSPFDAEQARALAERRTLVAEALATLSDADRDLLWWRDALGLSGEEAAAALGQSLAAMKSRLHRARLKLVAALREKGIAHAGT